MRRLCFLATLLLCSAAAFTQTAPAFRPFVSEQIVMVSQPGYSPVESISNVGLTYRVSRVNLYSVSRFRFFDHGSRAVTWISGGNYRYYRGFTAGVAEVNFHAYLPKSPNYVYWNAPSVQLGWNGKRDSILVLRTLGGGGVRVAHDNWSYQYEHRMTKNVSLIGEVQSYQYKYPNPKKSPRSMDAELNLGVKVYLR